jgi:mRNA interferase HicA
VTGKEFIRRARMLGRAKSLDVHVDKKRGKGSHQTLYYGDRKTIVHNPKDELKTGTFNAMLRQLGIGKHEL